MSVELIHNTMSGLAANQCTHSIAFKCIQMNWMGWEDIWFSGSLLIFSEKLIKGSGLSEGSGISKPSYLQESYFRTFSKDRNV